MRKATQMLLTLLLVVSVAIGGTDRRQEKLAEMAAERAALAQGTDSPAGVTASWFPLSIAVSGNSYNQVIVRANGVIWVGGYSASDDLLWRSTDNGATWTQIALTPYSANAGIVFDAIDADNAIFGTFAGEIFRTTDGGTTWNQVATYGSYPDGTDLGYVDGIKYADANTAYAIGDADSSGLYVAKTTDGGATWTRFTNLPAAEQEAVGYVAYATYRQCIDTYNNNVWINLYWGSTRNTRMLRTTDAGATWTSWEVPLANSPATNYYFRSINFLDENVGFAVDRQAGATSSFTNYWHKTTDGGLTWSDTLNFEAGLAHTSQRAVAIKPLRGTNSLWAFGHSGSGASARSRAWKSTDQGATWAAVAPNGTGEMRNGDFFDANTVYAVGVNQAYSLGANNPVTFQVNLKVKMKEGTFTPGAGDVVTVAGSFNSWSATVDTLTDSNNDSIYVKTVLIPNGDIFYKFTKLRASGTDWEGDPNRQHTVVDGAQTLPVTYFDRDSVANILVPVTFGVNMRVKMLEGTFDPVADKAVVAGGFNSWSTTSDPLSDLDGDSIYTATISDKLYEGTYYEYKFVKVRTASTDWEDNIGGNRNLTVPVGGTTLSVPYFDNDNLVSLPTTANILHTVDMTAYENLGWYRPDLGDSLELRGAPFGWDGNAPNLDPSPGQPGKYEYLQSYSGYTYDQFAMKYYMILEPVSAATRFPLFSAGADGVAYEHPSERGDGNRIYNIGTGGNIIAPDVYFSDIDPRGTLSDVQQVSVTLSVDMTPALAFATPFSPTNDTLFLHWQDALWRGSQIASQGAFTDYWPMTNAGGNIWQVTFTVKGKTHYNMQYTYVYRQPGGAQVETGTGLGQQNPFYTRFIKPNGPNTWPATYTAPTDTWKKSAPLPGETAPDFTVDVNDGKTQPYVYELRQNYPNPFNPSTTIRYSVAEASKVTLRVYNMLGQEVAMLVNSVQPAGNHTVAFDASNLSTGLYFYKLEAGKFSEVKKMMLLK